MVTCYAVAVIVLSLVGYCVAYLAYQRRIVVAIWDLLFCQLTKAQRIG